MTAEFHSYTQENPILPASDAPVCLVCDCKAASDKTLEDLPEYYRADVFDGFDIDSILCDDCFKEHDRYANACGICESVECLGCIQVDVDRWIPCYAADEYDPAD